MQETTAAGDSEEEEFDLIRPSLIKQLRSILDQYPDDGQMLKECIQNAEDAGATEIKFLFDEHSYPTENLHHPGLAEHQGPALYAYNDAVFQDADWLGIRLLQYSIKENDPLKVGRFGLGFKSVLHMTDLPSVISGAYLAVIDPHEQFFTKNDEKASGKRWHLKKKKPELLKIKDQIKPYAGIFGGFDENLETNFYSGTLFRFPLRQVTSKLSSTIYTPQKLAELLEAFQADAHLNLVFLKNVKNISVYSRNCSEDTPRLIYQVCLEPEESQLIQSNRDKVLRQIKASGNISVTYPLTVKMVRFQDSQETVTKTFRWLVNEYYSGNGGSDQLQKLKKELSYVPLVGVAMELPGVDEEQIEEQLQPMGQTFCALPLPVEQRSATGLPVHVNGFFAVGQNRRHLKWRSEGQNLKADSSVHWNHCLLTELLPKSYQQLILQAIELSASSTNRVSLESIYAAIPNMNEVDEKWRIILKPYFDNLLDEAIFYTQADNGQWILLDDAFFDYEHDDQSHVKSIIKRVLISAGVKLVSVPSRITDVLDTFRPNQRRLISPNIVRQTLISNPNTYRDLQKVEKMQLLSFIIKDGQFRELCSIELLPLDNGEFTNFDVSSVPVYIDNEEHPSRLLPGLENRMLSADIDETIRSQLRKASNDGSTRLQPLTSNIVRELMPDVIPSTWRHKEIIHWNTGDTTLKLSAAWLSDLWTYLRKNFPADLTMFEPLPILPISEGETLVTVQLTKPSVIILKMSDEYRLSESVCDILTSAGVHVIQDLPDYVRNHAGVVGIYVKRPLPEDMLDVLYSRAKHSGSEALIAHLKNIDESSRRDFVMLLAKLDTENVVQEKRSCLQDLPLFKCVVPKSSLLSRNHAKTAIERQTVLTKYAGEIIDASDELDFKVARLLDVTFLTECDILRDVVLNLMQKSEITAENLNDLMRYIFDNLPKYIREDRSIAQSLGDIPFVKAAKAPLRKPNTLFDPRSGTLKDLFLNEDVFPTGWYAEPENLVVLQQIGLRDETKITEKDIYNSFNVLQVMIDKISTNAPAKATAILEYLSENPEILAKFVEGKMLRDWANLKSWVPVQVTKPRSWPETLNWFKGACLCKPTEVKSDKWGNIVGCVVPIIEQPVSQSLAAHFGWTSQPEVEHVVEQLNRISRCYVEREKSKYLSLVMDIYSHLFLAEHKDIQASLEKMGLVNWVWHGDGFTSPESVVLRNDQIDLRPYVYVLPFEMHDAVPCDKNDSFLLKFGMREQISDEIELDILRRVKNKYDQCSNEANDVVHDLRLVITILKRVKHKYCHFSEHYKTKVYIPTKVEEPGYIRMLPINDCTYCDAEWLSQGLKHMVFDKEENINFIHPDLPVDTAKMLEVPTLMSRMLHADEFEICSFGQTEPITNRLKRLLDDYTDGLSIPKELIQNADDAGATEVKILYDERTNKDSMQYLLAEGMKECQGPALWVQNNAVFNDNDFSNITKLGGATKEFEGGKIGKFGLGFNAVYNVTDVPSLISRNHIVIFDPHLNHLGTAIKDRSKPGIRININRNRTLMRQLSDQFKPYQDIFGCDLSSESSGSYDGTLFRLPLRTCIQAERSKISGKVYNKTEMVELLKKLAESGHNLLLFTQNVCKVSVYHLRANADPRDCEKVISISKSPVQILRELTHSGTIQSAEGTDDDTKMLISNSSILKEAFKCMQSPNLDEKRKDGFPKSCFVVKTDVQVTDSKNELTSEKWPSDAVSYWLLSSRMGTADSLTIASSNKTCIPVAGTATPLTKREGGFVPELFESTSRGGQVFCYLPLPVFSGLPIHINAHFAIQANRRSLCDKTDDDKDFSKFEWNKALLKDPVVLAYLQMLATLTEICDRNSLVHFYELWPVTNQKQYFYPVIEAFYTLLLSSGDSCIFCEKGAQATIKSSVFLILGEGFVEKLVPIIKQIFVKHLNIEFAVVLPDSILTTIQRTGCENLIKEKLFDLERFYKDIFFPNISTLSVDLRDPLVAHALLLTDPVVRDLLQCTSCIPVSPDGKQLKKPNELVHPRGRVAQLYLPEDGRFPYGDVLTTNDCFQAFQELGLQVNKITWNDLLERAETMTRVRSTHADIYPKMLKQLLLFVEENTTEHEQGAIRDSCYSDEMTAFTSRLRCARFLPMMAKPRDCLVKWKSDELNLTNVLSPDDMYSGKYMRLISAIYPIVDDRTFSFEVKKILGLSDKEPTVSDIVAQMEHAAEVDPLKKCNRAQSSEFEKTWSTIYSYLQEKCSSDTGFQKHLPELIKNRPILLIEQSYVSPAKLAFRFTEKCAPYLYGVPIQMKRQCPEFLKCVGVRDEFNISDYIKSLQTMKYDHGVEKLNNTDLKVATKLLQQLDEAIKKSDVRDKALSAKHGPIYVPNAVGVLMPSASLFFNDCPWIPSTRQADVTHPSVSFQMIECIGVETKRQVTLNKHTKIMDFGQSETLTRSLNRVLRNYPFDTGILKEMIQNADDAEATEIHFVLDKRQLPKRHLFIDSWKSLQGPSLCVFNNKPFSEADLEGIQKLGEGSKEQDPSKTGQYGIGFSAMYHLTDVPLLLTQSTELGETLCVFDPHCRYNSDVNSSRPGMRLVNLDDLRTDYPHVFMGYLEDIFEVENGSIFRFPLRTKEQAKLSKISNTEVSISNLEKLLDELKQEAFDVLLFTNYIEKLSISEIDPDTGHLVNLFEVKLSSSTEDRVNRADMAASVKEAAKNFKSETLDLSDVPLKQTTYFFNVQDNLGNEEKWCVSQRLGISEGCELPETIVKAFDHKDLALMPRGGVACMLEKHSKTVQKRKLQHKVFCFMPLPVTTNLPIHINGHFVLGHENRRSLWTSSTTDDYKMDWNSFLHKSVIAPAYVELLTATRSYGINVILNRDNYLEVECSKKVIEKLLKNHESRFPGLCEDTKDLPQAVYYIIAENKARVLPVLRPKGLHKMGITEEIIRLWEIHWLPLNGTGQNKAYFVSPHTKKPDLESTGFRLSHYSQISQKPASKDQSDEEILESVLLDSGFKVFCLSEQFVNCLEMFGLTVNRMSSENVYFFFKSYRSENPICDIGDLPRPIAETPLRNERVLTIILKYCFKCKSFRSNFDGLPLLLTQDGQLRVFDRDNPVYYTAYRDLIPERDDVLLHDSLRSLSSIETDEANGISEFGITELAKLLPDSSLADKCHNTSDGYIKWKDNSKVPSEFWIKILWNFLSMCFDKLRGKTKPDQMRSCVLKEMQPLTRWCILPAKIGDVFYLFEVSKATEVLNLQEEDNDSKPARQVLLNLKAMPVFDSKCINEGRRNHPLPFCGIKYLTATLQSPCTIVYALHHNIVEHGNSDGLVKTDCTTLVRYFCANLNTLSDDTQNLLRDLPLYETICGDMVKLTGSSVYIVPSNIPINGLDCFKRTSGIVFLKNISELEELFSGLGCKQLTIDYLYLNFIIPQIHYASQDSEFFPPEDTLVHMLYLYKSHLTDDGSMSDKSQIWDKLKQLSSQKQLNFLTNKKGSVVSADELYDPSHPIFKVVIPKHKFPSGPKPPFTTQNWYSFLKELGMKTEVDKDTYLEFIREIIQDSNDPDRAKTLAKSRALVQWLFQMNEFNRVEISKHVSDIPFIAPTPVTPKLKEMHRQIGDLGDGKLTYFAFSKSVSREYENIIWSTLNVLPDWADPRNLRLEETEKEELRKALQIHHPPNPRFVIEHLSNLCKSDLLFNDKIHAKDRIEIFTAIYKFLQDNTDVKDTKIVSQLRNLPCLLVDNGNKLVSPSITVLNMHVGEEIDSYLYSVPCEFGQFCNLFKRLGLSDTFASVEQYRQVLHSVRKKAKSNSLHPNELRICLKATKGLFKSLEKSSEVQLDSLYLLSKQGTLVNANKLVFIDKPAFYERVREQLKMEFMVDLKECDYVNHRIEDTFKKLSVYVRPALLSGVLQETLPDSLQNTLSTSSAVNRLSERLKSTEFKRGLVRIIRHENYRNDAGLLDENMYEMIDRLSVITIHNVEVVRTHLLYKNAPVEGSEREKACFVEIITDASSAINHYKVFISHQSNTDDNTNPNLPQELLIQLAEVINKILNGILGESAIFMQALLSCEEEEMQRKLDRLSVRVDSGHMVTMEQVLPPLGSAVKEQDKLLLRENQTVFKSGDFVGYKENDEKAIVYAVIERTKPSTRGLPVYRLRTNADKIIEPVRADKLWMFDRNLD